jgi:hypothetical protein
MNAKLAAATVESSAVASAHFTAAIVAAVTAARRIVRARSAAALATSSKPTTKARAKMTEFQKVLHNGIARMAVAALKKRGFRPQNTMFASVDAGGEVTIGNLGCEMWIEDSTATAEEADVDAALRWYIKRYDDIVGLDEVVDCVPSKREGVEPCGRCPEVSPVGVGQGRRLCRLRPRRRWVLVPQEAEQVGDAVQRRGGAMKYTIGSRIGQGVDFLDGRTVEEWKVSRMTPAERQHYTVMKAAAAQSRKIYKLLAEVTELAESVADDFDWGIDDIEDETAREEKKQEALRRLAYLQAIATAVESKV